jgi:uncharacterized membrane protein YdjX (TVP38/TMEM64 family)
MTTPTGSEPDTASATSSSFKRWLPLLVLLLAVAVVLVMGWHKQLTIETVVANRARLRAFVSEHEGVAILGYMGIYAAVVAASLPGGALLTLVGGLLFGWLVGGLATVVAATIGATAIFLIARTALGELLAARAGPALSKLRLGFQQNALNYLLFLRLVPAFPFFLVNLAAALLGMPLGTYVLGTFLGIIPATFAFASAGAGLDSVIASAEAGYRACVAAQGAAACKLTVNLSNLVNTETKIAFVLLGIVALIPVALKHWSKRHANA